ncbi:hypothetical protein AMAG_04557 [Allomyces macrogynus ATCC 38327]|uniref:ACB domain-containing protein n=1 Tax=Allomyces macrogynus (strain ATCC 38327) TaxID=578462 RepID=A0A0L0S583_ALLM3|nr:hypothetical protein AMAG_04557 [Allomyces macrogynus ATCC 38327]|eukprot:KNE57698.1 hypothetical protein AMAG_04557 [Allomyces macrogynus ATCC 38327]
MHGADPQLAARFARAVDLVQSLSPADAADAPLAPSNAEKLRFYALYKQATRGDATGPRPGLFQVVARAKYDAWVALRGTPRTQAMSEYVEMLLAVLRRFPDRPQAQAVLASFTEERAGGDTLEVPNGGGGALPRVPSAVSTGTAHYDERYFSADEPEPESDGELDEEEEDEDEDEDENDETSRDPAAPVDEDLPVSRSRAWRPTSTPTADGASVASGVTVRAIALPPPSPTLRSASPGSPPANAAADESWTRASASTSNSSRASLSPRPRTLDSDPTPPQPRTLTDALAVIADLRAQLVGAKAAASIAACPVAGRRTPSPRPMPAVARARRVVTWIARHVGVAAILAVVLAAMMRVLRRRQSPAYAWALVAVRAVVEG